MFESIDGWGEIKSDQTLRCTRLSAMHRIQKVRRDILWCPVRLTNIAQQYITHHTARTLTRMSYKPPAIRVICLSIFLALFIACIGLIEWLISETTTTNTSFSSITTAVRKRELTTITTFDTSLLTCASVVHTEPCINRQQYNSLFSSGMVTRCAKSGSRLTYVI